MHSVIKRKITRTHTIEALVVYDLSSMDDIPLSAYHMHLSETIMPGWTVPAQPWEGEQ